MFADQCLTRLVEYKRLKNILDVGSGAGQHAGILRERGFKVTTISLKPPADIVGDFMIEDVEKFDGIWASHVFEHTLNPHDFLRKCYDTLNERGVLAITVPPLKHNIVGGHINLFNMGVLLYRLVLAGFNCKNARVGTYDYNLSVIVEKSGFTMPRLNMDCGDIEALRDFFPMDVAQNFDGRIQNVNW
jgi:SAM-dependent methyltransferase